ncbi:MAG: FeoB-associated Cys-rich membrane protein [Clostridiales bacterium]
MGFLSANWGTILSGAIVFAVVVLIIGKLCKDRAAGKPCCGGDCHICLRGRCVVKSQYKKAHRP